MFWNDIAGDGEETKNEQRKWVILEVGSFGWTHRTHHRFHPKTHLSFSHIKSYQQLLRMIYHLQTYVTAGIKTASNILGVFYSVNSQYQSYISPYPSLSVFLSMICFSLFCPSKVCFFVSDIGCTFFWPNRNFRDFWLYSFTTSLLVPIML